jgi:enediyne biosynthesis protein E4
VFGDFDLDGDEDLFAANGHVIRHPGNSTILQRPLLLLNEQGRRFRDVANSAGAYLASEHMSRGVAQGDLDHDGDIDLVISNIGQPLAILRNESIRAGNWISLDLIGTETARWAEGARVEFIVENQSTILRLRKGGTSYASTSGRSVHAGLGRCQRIAAIVVHWPSGIMQRFEGVPANQHLTVVEGRAQLIPVTADTAIAE